MVKDLAAGVRGRARCSRPAAVIAGRDEGARRRLTPETMTPDQRAAYERRKAARETPEARARLGREIEAIRGEFPPLAADEALLGVLASLRRERERLGLSLSDVMER